MIRQMYKRYRWLVLIALISTLAFTLIGCGGTAAPGSADTSTDVSSESSTDAEAADDAESAAATDTPPPVASGSPSEVVQRYAEACAIGDITTAITFFTSATQSNIRSYDSSNACLYIPADADSNQLHNTSTAGATEIVEWEWFSAKETFQGWPIEDIQRFVFNLSEENGEWRIVSKTDTPLIRKEYSYRVLKEQVAPDDPIYIANDNLLKGIAYSEQFQIVGERVITTEYVTLTGEGLISETVVGEEITREPVQAIVHHGTKPVEEVNAQVKQLVTDYFDQLQSGDYDAVIALTQDETFQAEDGDFGRIPRAANEIGFAIDSFTVGNIREYLQYATPPQSPTSLSKNDRIEYQPFNYPIAMKALIPVTVNYSVYGRNQTYQGDLVLTQYPNENWLVNNWAFYAAGDIEGDMEGNGITLSLDKMAVAGFGSYLRVIIDSEHAINAGDGAEIKVTSISDMYGTVGDRGLFAPVEGDVRAYDVLYSRAPSSLQNILLKMSTRLSIVAPTTLGEFTVSLP